MNETPHEQPAPPGGEDDDEFDHEFQEPRRRGILSGRGLAAAGVAALVLLGGGAALALSRDGGGGAGSASSSGDGGSPQEEAALEYAGCMRDEGIEDFPDPEFGAAGGISFATPDELRESPGFAAAHEACQPLLEAAGPPPPPEGQEPLTPEELADLQDRWLAAAQCVRAQGYDYPDPEVDEFGRVRMVETNDAGSAQAVRECLEEAGVGEPQGGEGGPGAGEEGSP